MEREEVDKRSSFVQERTLKGVMRGTSSSCTKRPKRD